LDKAEREHLEDVVEDLRKRVEDNIRFQLTQNGLDDEPQDRDSLDGNTKRLVEAIDLEGVNGHTWEEAFEQYVTGVGYTIVNRLAALRCMEVRDFIDEEVTFFKDNGLTPAAETLVHEEFLLEDEAILEGYRRSCDNLAEEIEILFDRSTAYSQIDPDADTFAELCQMLDRVDDEFWRADDVLGWVYEYYNVAKLDAVRDKARESRLGVEDVSVANQFYTPHWVVRMLTDNSLGKYYLECQNKLSTATESQRGLSTEERKEREVKDTDKVEELCTYLFADENTNQRPEKEIDDPAEIRVIDPACGSGHFLLYAFDVLERIWWQERPEIERHKIPAKILEHNLYGVDIDRRATQLAAFNLYLKGRERAKVQGAESFELDTVGIVCADAKVANMDSVSAVIDEVAAEQPAIREPLQEIVSAFEDVHGLGSLLDVKGTLSEEMLKEQTTLLDSWDGIRSLPVLIDQLRDAIDEHRDLGGFVSDDLHSFLSLLGVLTQSYDVALMNPPYGSQRRMPDEVKEYVKEHYKYYPEYYINFFEMCQSLTKEDGRIGMLVPRSFMFRRTFRDFREDFVGELGSFDFLAEFGKGILDNATVRTVGTVVRNNSSREQNGTFIRLYDPNPDEKEQAFIDCLSRSTGNDVRRIFNVPLKEFSQIPWTPISYTLPQSARKLHQSTKKIDPSASDIEGEGIADIAQGLATGDNDRFVRRFWEVPPKSESFKPYAKGGAEAWVMPNVDMMVNFRNNGREMRPLPGSRLQNSRYYGREGLTWTYIKSTGRRFGYLPEGSIFDQRGPMCFPNKVSPWILMSVLNSTLYHGLFLSLTPEREWTVGDLGRIPWTDELADMSELADLAHEQYQLVKALRSHNPTSPYYTGPALLPGDLSFFYDHPYTEAEEITSTKFDYRINADQSIRSAVRVVEEQKQEMQQRLETLATSIDDLVYEQLQIGEDDREEIRTEITLRTGTDPNLHGQQIDTVSIDDETVLEYGKELLHYCVLTEIRDADDGIVPIVSIDNRPDIVERVVARLEKYFGEQTPARLNEIDSLLGSKQADKDAYPNIREWLSADLFEYHTELMENRPVLWRFTSNRMVSDPSGEGFACYVDYHSLEAGTFDRLQTQYLEPRKLALRERRNAADRQRSDESLSTSEQAAAAEEYERSVSGLQQIERLEEALQQLMRTNLREWPESAQERAEQLEQKVRQFRKQTQRRLDNLDRLRDLHTDEWFEERFSPTFLKSVKNNKEEWEEALKDLESSCESYSKGADEPVAPHQYDLLGYFEDLVGSDHYSSNGILFMTYYFEREGTAFLNKDGEPKEDLLEEDTKLLAELATGLEEYKSLATEIQEDCEYLQQHSPSDWETRAISEITTGGYQPNQNHGVEINITPLSDAEIVPKIVDDMVL
jgi:type I restriction-modification system DNA methylase subunit